MKMEVLVGLRRVWASPRFRLVADATGASSVPQRQRGGSPAKILGLSCSLSEGQ